MGIGMALLAWAVIGFVLSGFAGSALGVATFLLTGRVSQRRWPIIVSACVLPFSCLLWSGFVFGVQAYINEAYLHRDAGLGDAWKCPLPNEYMILMIDTTEDGWVYNPKTQSEDAVGEREDAISGVR